MRRPTSGFRAPVVDHECLQETCGQPRHIRGRAPKGWIRVHLAADHAEPLWFCSWNCVSWYAIGEEIAGRDMPDTRTGVPT